MSGGGPQSIPHPMTTARLHLTSGPELVRPLLRAVQDPQYPDGLPIDPVGGDIRCSLNDQFARSLNATRTSNLRRFDQKFHLGLYAIVDPDGGPRAVGFR